MRLEGVHHVTLITGDAPRNVDFYTRVLGLRLVKKTVNQDDPTVYHLFYADEKGSAGSDITFFEYPGAARGKAGPGMVHTIVWRVGSEDSLDFWEQRLEGEAGNVTRSGESLSSRIRRGSGTNCAVDKTDDEPLSAKHPEIPEEHALRGFAGVRAYAIDPGRSSAMLEDTLGFKPDGDHTGRPAATSAAASTPTTRHRTAGASPARARSTTSRGRRTWTSTRPGRSGLQRRASGRRR